MISAFQALERLQEAGGLSAIAEINERKAQKLYTAIDSSDFYSNPVRVDCRSWMNVPFTLARPELDGEFLAQAEAAGFRMIMDGSGFGPDGDGHYAYIDTEAVYGVTLELIQRPKRRHPPEKVYPPED